MGNLAGADVVAGLVVELGAPMEKLRADLGQAKQYLASAESHMKIGVKLDAAKLKNEARLAISSASDGLTLRIGMDTSSARSAIGSLKTELASLQAVAKQIVGPGGTIGLADAVSRMRAGVAGGGSVNGASSQQAGVSGPTAQWWIGNGGGSAGNYFGNSYIAGGPQQRVVGGATWLAGLRGIKSDEPTEQGMGPLGRKAAGIFAIAETAHLGVAAMDRRSKIGIAKTATDQYAAEQNYIGEVERTPIFGSIGQLLEHVPLQNMNWITGKAGDKWKSGSDLKAEAAQMIQRAATTDAQGDRMLARGLARQKIVDASDFAHATIGLTETGVAVARADKALADFDTQYGTLDANGRVNLKGIKQPIIDTRVALVRDRADAAAEDKLRRGEILGVSKLGLAGSQMAVAAGQSEMAGNSEQAAQQAAAAARMKLQAAGASKLVGVRNQDDRDEITKQNIAELAEFDVRTAKDTADRKVRIAIDASSVIGVKEESRLRIAHAGYEADLKAFDRAAKEKLASITDLTAKQNEAARLAAERGVLVAGQQQAQAQTIAGLQAAGNVATLRAGHQNNKAELSQFDADTASAIALADASSKAAVTASRAEQRKALIETQRQRQVDIDSSLETRRQQAVALGSNEPRTAQVIGLIAGERSELRHAEKDDRINVAKTELAELKSAKEQMLVPTGYATTGLGKYEAYGGPSGKAGQDQADAMKLLTDAINDLTKKINKGGAGLGN